MPPVVPHCCAGDGRRSRLPAGLPALPPRALAQGVEHQPAGTAEQGDQTPHQRGRHLPQRRCDRAALSSQLLEQQEEWQL